MNRNKPLVVCIICLLILISIPMVSSDDTSFAPSNNGGLVDNVKLTVEKSHWLQTLLRGSVFKVKLWNRNNCTVNYYLEVDVTSRKGNVIFKRENHLVHPSLDPYIPHEWGFWYYIQFRQQGFLFGFFDINVRIQLVEDASIKTLTAHGIIFGISASIWGGR